MAGFMKIGSQVWGKFFGILLVLLYLNLWGMSFMVIDIKMIESVLQCTEILWLSGYHK